MTRILFAFCLLLAGCVGDSGGKSGRACEGSWFEDADDDGFGDPKTELFCQQDGLIPVGGDCNDKVREINPDAPELCDGIDNNCDGLIDDQDLGFSRASATWYFVDADRDGYGDPTTGIQKCNAPTGHVDNDGDCDDADPDRSPDATEVCNNRDDDCDRHIDDADDDLDLSTRVLWWPDADNDTFGDETATPTSACGPPLTGWVSDGTDCDDDDRTVYPGSSEVCNSVDDDCDTLVDDDDPSLDTMLAATFYTDADDDGYGDPTSWVNACLAPSGTVTDATDCYDDIPTAYPTAPPACDGVDSDCGGTIEELLVPTAFATIQAAVDAATPGDVVCVEDGTHTGGVAITKNLTLTSLHGSGAATLDGDGASTALAIANSPGDIRVSGLTVTGAGSTAIGLAGGDGVWLEDLVLSGLDCDTGISNAGVEADLRDITVRGNALGEAVSWNNSSTPFGAIDGLYVYNNVGATNAPFSLVHIHHTGTGTAGLTHIDIRGNYLDSSQSGVLDLVGADVSALLVAGNSNNSAHAAGLVRIEDSMLTDITLHANTGGPALTSDGTSTVAGYEISNHSYTGTEPGGLYLASGTLTAGGSIGGNLFANPLGANSLQYSDGITHTIAPIGLDPTYDTTPRDPWNWDLRLPGTWAGTTQLGEVIGAYGDRVAPW